MASLLPLNSTLQEHALDLIAEKKLEMDLSGVDMHPLTCPVTLLPYLAHSWKVDIHGLAEKEARQLIFNAPEIHQYKGTVYAVKMALGSIFESSTIIEHSDERVFEFDAKVMFKADSSSYYNRDKFDAARKLINTAKNGRSRFVHFDVELPPAQTTYTVNTALTWDLVLGDNL